MIDIPKRRSHDEFIILLKDIVGEEYTVLTRYTNSTSKVLVRHNSDMCGNHEYWVKPYKILDNRRCPICAMKKNGIDKRKRKDVFEKEFSDMLGKEYELLSEYVTSTKYVKLKHMICGHEYMASPNAILSGNKCPNCAKNKKKDTQVFMLEVHESTNGEYELLSEYVTSSDKVVIRHNNASCDNHTYEVSPAMFSSGNRCPKCGNNIKKTNTEFLNEVYEQVGDEYTVLTQYENTNKHILIRHNCDVCNNNEYMVTPHSFLAGRRCNICAMKQNGINARKTQSQFEKEIFDLYRDEYTVLGEYIMDSQKVLIRHNCDKCNNYEWEVTPNDILHNKRCPKCRASKLEDRTSNTLDILKIEYIEQYRFKDCRNVLALPFDFYIPSMNTCIECQGKQHYEPVDYFGGKTQFELQNKLDRIKKNYCKTNGIRLLEIPYWEFKNIETILKKELGVD